MPSHSPDGAERSPASGGPRGARVLVLGAVVVVGVLAGLILENLYRGPRGASVAAPTGGVATPAAPGAPVGGSPASPRPRVAPPVAATEKMEVPPWEATPENTPSVPPGHIPAWAVRPPRPDPHAEPPPPPVEPPDPATHRPPMHNPGGVNGDRPPRPVPGLPPP